MTITTLATTTSIGELATLAYVAAWFILVRVID